MGSVNTTGYGVLTVDLRTRTVHRLAYQEFIGPIAPGVEVMHSCDNPPCINPAHLSLGSHAQNMADMSARGRAAKGERHPRVKLSDAQVGEIFELRRQGWKQRQLAGRFGVDSTFISRLLRGVRGSGRTDDEPFPKKGLTIEAIRDIRASRAAGVPGAVLSTRYGITTGNVYAIAGRRLHGDKD